MELKERMGLGVVELEAETSLPHRWDGVLPPVPQERGHRVRLGFYSIVLFLCYSTFRDSFSLFLARSDVSFIFYPSLASC